MKLLALATFALTAYAQINYAKIEILTEQYTPNLYMLAGAPGDADPNHPDGAGGRIGLLTGPDGIFMVDSQYEQVTAKVLAAIRKISPQPRINPEIPDISAPGYRTHHGRPGSPR